MSNRDPTPPEGLLGIAWSGLVHMAPLVVLLALLLYVSGAREAPRVELLSPLAELAEDEVPVAAYEALLLCSHHCDPSLAPRLAAARNCRRRRRQRLRCPPRASPPPLRQLLPSPPEPPSPLLRSALATVLPWRVSELVA